MYHVFFTHSSVNGHLDCFYVLAIVIPAAINSMQCEVRGSTDFGVRQIEVPFKGVEFTCWLYTHHLAHWVSFFLSGMIS